MNLKIFYKCLKENGFERAIKSFIRHILFDIAYIKKLSSIYPKKIPYSKLDIRIMSATDLKFKDQHFDFIFSGAVFEHIDDVPTVVREVNRVLKNSGIAWISIHLFPSLSGGHHLEWISPDKRPSKKVPPWDHLLDNIYAVNTYLNKLRLNQYRKVFYDNISVVDEKIKLEGGNILSSELKKILLSKGYTEDDLLTPNVTFLCQRK